MKHFLKRNGVFLGLFLLSALMCAVTVEYNAIIAAIEAIILAAVFLLAFVTHTISRGRADSMIKSIAGTLDFSKRDAIKTFPLSVLICDTAGKIVWYNQLFSSRVIGDAQPSSEDALQFLPGYTVEDIASHNRIRVHYNDNYFSVYPTMFSAEKQNCYALIFTNETELNKTYIEYVQSRPVVLLVSIDNLDDLLQSYSDSDSDAMRSGAEKLIDAWLSDYSCLVRKLGDGRFVVVGEERDLRSMTEKKFDLLDSVRSFEYNGKVTGMTLSIGVGKGENLRACEKNARQALDMAMGRGGDQAAIFLKDSYEFFGGVSKGIEKRNKAKTRIVASAISKLIETSDNVFIMGHRFSDMDCVGASAGVLCAARAAGKTTKIVIDRERSLAQTLIEPLEMEFGDVFCNEKTALDMMTKSSLLFILDTHRVEVLESAEVYRAAETVVLIDHHRKNVDFINDTLVFHHDTNASSTAEMVAELLQLMPTKPEIQPIVADALLAGIMLDTRNFALKTGVRTFEAAAFLRSKGADTVRVKRLFVNRMEDVKLRSEVVSSADIYRDCAIAVADVNSPEIRTITSQAADELLNIEGVKASFAMFSQNGTVNISARSLGDMNVQLIMETLGGGGHQTMAAAQLKSCDTDTARAKLCAAIDGFYEKQS